MKKMCKHEKVALFLTITAILLMSLSCCPGGWVEATGLLQGFSTGLLSGMVLLLVAGIKEQEIRDLSDDYDFFLKSSKAFMTILESYSFLYHDTYHGKKEGMSFKAYADLIDDTYMKYNLAYKELASLDRSFEEKDDIAKNIFELANILDNGLHNIRQKIYGSSANGKDKALLNEAREMFYELQYEVNGLYPKNSQKMWQICEKIKRIKSSLL